MNFKLLCKGLTVQQFNQVAENWYSRLNNLKEWYSNNSDDKAAYKAKILIEEMIARMTVISQLYIKLNRHPVPKSFKSGSPDKTNTLTNSHNN